MFRFICLGVSLLILIGCQQVSDLSPGEGYIPLKDGQVWYKVVGEGKGTPLLLLHGGPGATSYYLNPMESLGVNRPIIFLDQLGCGRSKAKIDTSLMTIEHSVAQLEEFRKALGLDEFYLYGHSWGTMLGMDYYLKYPDGIKGLIMASPALSVDRWTSDANQLIAQLPDSVQATIWEHTEAGTFESAEFQYAMGIYYSRHVVRKTPWSADIDSTFANLSEEIYVHMWGPSEFTAIGTLKTYERTDQLPEIQVPTLFVTGEFDEATPATVEYYHQLVPNSEFKVISNAAHVTMHDNTEENNQVINEFLARLDSQ